jgi:hypothetical protein
MVAKIMCLSLVWYHAGIRPGWEPALQHIEKRVQSFIWKGSIPKVAKSTLRLPKNEEGLQVWSLVDKAKAFTTMWVVKLIQNKTNPFWNPLSKLNWYTNTRGTEVPLWESRLNHSHDITATTSIKLLALMQGAWANVVCRNPAIQEGD